MQSICQTPNLASAALIYAQDTRYLRFSRLGWQLLLQMSKTVTSSRCDACVMLTAVRGFGRREKGLAFAPSECSIPQVAFHRGKDLRVSPLLVTRFPGRSDRHARSAKGGSEENEYA